VPQKTEMNCNGLEDELPDMSQLLSSPTTFWREEVEEIRQYFNTQVGDSLPKEMWEQLALMEKRIELFAEEEEEEEVDNY